MAEKEKGEKTFKVEDRRTSSCGRENDRQGPDPGKAPEEARPGGRDTGAEAGKKAPEGGGGVPKVDFSTFVFSLFSSALIQMGDMADPITGNVEKNLVAAQQTIDILDVLAGKTKGNLTEQEDRLLKSASAELKWKYLDAVKETR